MPRFSRISWKSRDEAEPPRIESRIEAANRRGSERAIPGAPTQTWYCSVSFFEAEARWRRLHERPPDTRAPGRGPPLALCAREHADELVVLDVPRCRDHDVAARVHLAVIRGEHALRHRRDDVGRSDHWTSVRMASEDRLREEIVHELLGRVLVHGDLLEDDGPLGVKVLERGREHHVGHDVERGLDVSIRDAGVDHRVLTRRRRVELAAEAVEDLRDLLRRV